MSDVLATFLTLCGATIPAPDDIVKVGSKVQALRNLEFTYGSWHSKGEVFEVTEEDLSYFRLFTDNKHNYKLQLNNENNGEQ
jgi:hypothetical protein